MSLPIAASHRSNSDAPSRLSVDLDIFASLGITFFVLLLLVHNFSDFTLELNFLPLGSGVHGQTRIQTSRRG